MREKVQQWHYWCRQPRPLETSHMHMELSRALGKRCSPLYVVTFFLFKTEHFHNCIR